ncbi:ABC transporter permease [Sulfitobacter mediterraneus]|uniref:Monosaccharide ABC transporter membrane protein (CUT2 family) n=1 Tax=Sulfitobacter mediterraneus TaxID=83219 RepID=A0A2T6CBC5_9RHOB|nr:ABC transporter permease [Sulfitobacter mediterraneus]KIN76992.1 ABC sugar transporter, inner membrane subunit [Sulfitobacter mediterraneus KCTC 32188]PTX72801.1 monosaccharide ABC transporter membrane protein (CUT2 family) [Sulfitobacter mediterraneus]
MTMTKATDMTGSSASGKMNFGQLARDNGTFLALIALILINMIITPNFLQVQTLYVNLTQVATIAIVAIGMTLVIASAGIDLSVGAVMALSGALAPFVFLSEFGMASPGLALVLSIAVALLAGLLCGMFNGWLINQFAIQPIVATLVLFIAARGLAQVLTNGNLQVFDNPAFEFIGSGRVLGIPFQALMAVAFALILSWVVRRTAYGRYLLAVGGNAKAARLSGISVNRVRLATYAICGVLAGFAGMVVSAINSASDANQTGQLMELDAIAAAVVGGSNLMGGKAPIIGALIGAAIIQLVKYTLLANGVHDAVALIAKAVIIILAVYFQFNRSE